MNNDAPVQEMITPIPGVKIRNTKHPQREFFGKKIGIVVMAGGQATRLNSDLPKGVVPFEPNTGRSLFARLSDKLKAFGSLYKSPPLLAIMTSAHTDEKTQQHFSDNNNFGLENVAFFMQPSLPLLTTNNTPALDSFGKPLYGPDGNGSVFKSFAASGLLQEWIDQKVDAVGIVMIDNAMLDPFHPDLYLSVFHGIAMTAGAVVREDPFEKVGLFARKQGKTLVLEYSEIDPVLQMAQSADGSLLYNLANISFFVTTPDVIAKLAKISTQLHAAKKITAGQEVWKSEYFIFDYLPYIDNVEVVLIDRILYFAPIKDPLSFAEAQRHLAL
jgi:UDP-N-acetylglucosamine/UDP-N-acetylgalactosamine diphosphorylase